MKKRTQFVYVAQKQTGQRRQQDFLENRNCRSKIFKIKMLKFGWFTPGYVIGNVDFSDDCTVQRNVPDRQKSTISGQ